MMRLLFISLVFLFASASSAHAAPGFIEESLWLSREPVFAGQSVRIFTVVANPSSDSLDGTVVFFDAEKELGRRGVSLSPGASELVSIEWQSSEGGHEIFAQFKSGDGTVIEKTTSEKLVRHIVADTDTDGIGDNIDTDDDNDGILDVNDEEPLVARKDEKETSAGGSIHEKVTNLVGPALEEQTPKIIAAARSAADSVEEFRKTQGNTLKEIHGTLKAEIEASDTAQGQQEENGEQESSFTNSLQLAAVSIAAVVFNNMLLFYLVVLTGLYVLVRKGVGFIRRKTAADRLE